jgi:hypothetical protein
VKVKTRPRARIAYVAGVAFLLIAGLALFRSRAVERDDQSIASRVETARQPASIPAPENFAEPAGVDSAIASTSDAAALASTARLASTALPAVPIAANDGTLQYADPKDWVKSELPCWGLRGTTPQDFVVAADRHILTTGKSSASIEAARLTSGWGTLYQFADAQDLRGKRIEFSADIRTAAVGRTAGIFVRVDDANGKAVALDNMWYSYGEDRSGIGAVNRSLSGDHEWTTERVVLDIPPDASAVSYGVILDGPGKLWIDNAHLEIVGSDIPTTAITRPSTLLQQRPFPLSGKPPSPRNLDFEKGGANGQCD